MLCDTRNSDSHWVVGDEMNLVAVGEVFYPALCVDASSIGNETDLQFDSPKKIFNKMSCLQLRMSCYMRQMNINIEA